MNLKKTAAIAAAVGALAAVSVPAFAIENEFHGMYRLRGIMSNFENANATVVLGKDAPTATVFEQRARIQYIAKTSDDLKLVTHFEVDSSWGDTAYQNGRGMGGGMAADTVNLETKHIYLDFNESATGANFKIGILPIVDTYKGIFINDDVAGVLTAKKFGALTAAAGYFRLQDFTRTTPPTATTTLAGATAGAITAANPATTATTSIVAFETANPIGRKNLDLYILDAKYAVSKDLTVGGAYYLLALDNAYQGQNIHVLGVNAAAKFGTISADAFFAYQFGDALNSQSAVATKGAFGTVDLSAFAIQAAVKADLAAAGTVRFNALYASGDDGKDATKNKAWTSTNSGDTLATSSNTYYDSKMMLLMRNVVNMDTDKAIVQTINNNNRGLTLFTLGYDYKFSDKLALTANVGYAAASQKAKADSASIGTEINTQIDYKLFSNLTASLQLAYVFLGEGLDKATGTRLGGTTTGVANADDPYLTCLMFNYTF